MKNLIIITLCFWGFANTSFAQQINTFNDMTLSTYISNIVKEKITPAATNVLETKLEQIISKNGMTNALSNFVITPNITPITKNVLGTAPTIIAYTIDVSFHIGEGVEGNRFSTFSKTVRGVGKTETKAYINALKSIKPKSKEIQDFVEKGRARIINYYNSKCNVVITKAQLAESQKNYGEALYILTSVPESSTDCYQETMDLALKIYDKEKNFECRELLNQAKVYWASNPTEEGATEVASILQNVDASSDCVNDINQFTDAVSQEILKRDKREWNFKIDKEVKLTKEKINAAKAIGTAYGEGQPDKVYNIKGWL